MEVWIHIKLWDRTGLRRAIWIEIGSGMESGMGTGSIGVTSGT